MAQYEMKIKSLLEKFLTPDYQIQNDVYLNSLLSHLSGKDDTELGKQIASLSCIIEWIPQAITTWEQTTKPPSNTIKSFFLNLTAICSQNETSFDKLNAHNIYNKIFTIFNINSPHLQPGIKLAYVKILASFVQHKSGLEWLMSNHAWMDGLNFCLANQTVYIIREGHDFIYNLLLKSIGFNEVFTHSVVAEILKVFDDNYVNINAHFPEVQDEALQKQLGASLRLINYVFDRLVEDDVYKRRDYRLAQIMISYKLEELIDKVLILSRDSGFLFELYSVLFHIYCFDMLIQSENDKIDLESLRRTGKLMLQKIGGLIVNRFKVRTILKLCHLADYHWTQFADRRPEYPKGIHQFKFQNQLIVMESMPILCVSMKHCNLSIHDISKDDIRDLFVENIFKMMCEDTIRAAYSWRDILLDEPNMFENATVAILSALKSKKLYSKSRAILMFAGFMFLLKDIQQRLRDSPTSFELFSKEVTFFITLLEALGVFIEDFQITWRDSVQTICVMSCTIELFLNNYIWPPRLVVQALKVVNLSIAKFMSPNLALLVEEENDTTMDLLGPMLCGKLADTHWEVRDSALEILHTISHISKDKYPPFQTMLMELDLIKLVVIMSVSDSEGFVRASALKCLQEMIQVQAFWTKVLMDQELPQKMMYSLRYETEAIVRTEAASLMRHIHEYQSFPEELMDEIYNSMAYAATSDLHWEVKINALDFWGKVILNHLLEQGYIDGKFPNVTFSKENRKIVTLTEAEVQARLNKVLVQLSKNGCLGVLVNAIQDDCDLEVAKKSLAKTKKMAAILARHNLKSTYNERTIPHSPVLTNPTSPMTYNKIDFSDDVIDQIINSDDINLLANVFNPDFEAVSNGVHSSLKIITPDMFVNFIQGDLDSIITEKTKWLNKLDDLDALLDDMLKTYENNVNAMDCY